MDILIIPYTTLNILLTISIIIVNISISIKTDNNKDKQNSKLKQYPACWWQYPLIIFNMIIYRIQYH